MSEDRKRKSDPAVAQRRLVEAALGKRISDWEWDGLRRLQGDDWHDFDAEDWAGVLREHLEAFDSGSDVGVLPAGPSLEKRWDDSRRVLEQYRDDQVRALAILGRSDFLPRESIESVLREIAELDGDRKGRDEQNCDTLWCYPHHADRPRYDAPDFEFEPFSYPQRMEPIRFYRGFGCDESYDAYEAALPQGAGQMNFQDPRLDAALEASKLWEAMRLSRLARIKALASALTRTTDCLEADAVAFLLSDTPFLLPRVRVLRERRQFGAYEPVGDYWDKYRWPLAIRVAGTDIPAGEVLDAYQKAREMLLRKSPPMSPAERDALLLEFHSQTPELTWRGRMEKWNAAKGRPAFETAARMKAIYHKAHKREEARGGTDKR